LICESEIWIGHRVRIGWHVTIVDSDFHPVDPPERLVDVRALSPSSRGIPRPPHVTVPVTIEDDVWIGPNATVLKGVRIGARAVVQPGSVVTRDVHPDVCVGGNPARPQ
jgi:acetyltransferase-like isoleucine patch superfamily enzyme